MPRVTLFLHQWLISRTGREIPQSRLFPEFKNFVEDRADVRVAELVGELTASAKVYRALVEEAASPNPTIGRLALAVHRFEAVDTQVATPVLVWLTDPRNAVLADVAERAVEHLESWVVRRMLMRATTADLGRVTAQLLTVLDGGDAPADEVVWEL